MRIILAIEKSGNGTTYELRARTEAEPVKHTMEGTFDFIEDAEEFAQTMRRGAELMGATVAITASEEIADEMPNLFNYTKEMRTMSFDDAWDAL